MRDIKTAKHGERVTVYCITIIVHGLSNSGTTQKHSDFNKIIERLKPILFEKYGYNKNSMATLMIEKSVGPLGGKCKIDVLYQKKGKLGLLEYQK